MLSLFTMSQLISKSTNLSSQKLGFPHPPLPVPRCSQPPFYQVNLLHQFSTRMGALFSKQQNDSLKADTEPPKEQNSSTKTLAEILKELNCDRCAFCTEIKSLTMIWVSKCPSKHLICYDCVRRCYEYSIHSMDTNRALCCRIQMWDDTVHYEILGNELADKWRDCVKALRTPDQLYCSTSECWRPLFPPAHESGTTAYMTCPNCGLSTCTFCRGPVHPNENCGTDDGEAGAQTFRLAESQGWKRCFRCRRIVERAEGCSTITCTCGVSFCFSCGKSTHICECPKGVDE